MKLSIYRYNPEHDDPPRMQAYEVQPEAGDKKLLDLLMRLRVQDDSLSFRRSCREGVCGSDAMNINGRNGLACLTALDGLKEPIVLRPLPGFPVIRDLIVDMTQFFQQYHSIRPYLVNDEPAPAKERLQSPRERERLNGAYECILCAFCSSQCPSSSMRCAPSADQRGQSTAPRRHRYSRANGSSSDASDTAPAAPVAGAAPGAPAGSGCACTRTSGSGAMRRP